MKRLILLLALLTLPLAADATDVYVLYQDTMTSSDTDGTRIDTVYTSAINTAGAKRLWLSIQITGAGWMYKDTNWANDTVFYFVQHSPDRKNWTTIDETDSLNCVKGANDTIFNSAIVINRDSVFIADWLRVRFEHHDSLTEANINGNNYGSFYRAWINRLD